MFFIGPITEKNKNFSFSNGTDVLELVYWKKITDEI
jgi:hypothetical protein